ncbi:MAG: class I SAM-dependent methyltransferase [Pseudomonadota bacterium]
MTSQPKNARTENDPAVQRRLARSGLGVVSRHCAEELISRLDMLAVTPSQVACLGWDPVVIDALRSRWPKSSLTVVESNPELARHARKSARRALRRPVFEVEATPLDHLPEREPKFDFAVANLTLARSATPDAALAAIARSLAPSAGLVISHPGPDTLRELRDAWANDSHVHTASFADMHDLGSAFARHGFTESVLNVERLTFEYRTLDRLWQDLTDQGARNSEPGRRPTLTGTNRFRQMCSRLKNAEGGVSITVELIYAQTWRANSVSADRNLPQNEVRIDLDQLTRR